MHARPTQEHERLWELVAALRRGRPEPEMQRDEEEFAATAALLHDALRVDADPERQTLSRDRLLEALRAEPQSETERLVVAPGGSRGPISLLVSILMPVVLGGLLALATWRLPALGARLAREDLVAASARRPPWESRYYPGTLRAAEQDSDLRLELQEPGGFLYRD